MGTMSLEVAWERIISPRLGAPVFFGTDKIIVLGNRNLAVLLSILQNAGQNFSLGVGNIESLEIVISVDTSKFIFEPLIELMNMGPA